jgi:hypothetical protein
MDKINGDVERAVLLPKFLGSLLGPFADTPGNLGIKRFAGHGVLDDGLSVQIGDLVNGLHERIFGSFYSAVKVGWPMKRHRQSARKPPPRYRNEGVLLGNGAEPSRARILPRVSAHGAGNTERSMHIRKEGDHWVIAGYSRIIDETCDYWTGDRWSNQPSSAKTFSTADEAQRYLDQNWMVLIPE